MSAPTIGTTPLPVTTASTSSAQSSDDSNDASAPHFAAALSAAHAHGSASRNPDAKQTSTTDTAKGKAHGPSDAAVLDLPLQGANPVTITATGAGFRPVGTAANQSGSHKVRLGPQDADTNATAAAALESIVPGADVSAGVLANAGATASVATATPVAATSTATAAGAAGTAVSGVSAATSAATATSVAEAGTADTAVASAQAPATATKPRTAGTAAPHAHATSTTAATATPATNAAAQPANAATAVQAGTRDADRDNGRDGSRDNGATAIGRTDAAAAASAQNAQQATQPSAVAPATATAASTATGSTYAAAQPELGQSLAHLSTRANGEHEMTVSLHPAELGAVHVRALLHDGVLTVTIACADESARHAVTAALPSLHSQLSDLKSLDVQLSGGHSDDRSAGNAQAQNQAQSQQNGSSDRRQPAAAGLSGTADSTGAISSTNSTTSVRRTGGRNDGLDRWM